MGKYEKPQRNDVNSTERNDVNSTERSEILDFNCYLCHVRFLLTCYVCSTKIGEISDISKCFGNFVSQALGVLTRIYAAELRDSTFSLRDMMIKVLLISLIYNMSIGLWSPPVGDKFDKELFDRYQKNGSYEYHHKENTILLYDTGNTYKKSIYPDSCAITYHTTYYKEGLTVKGKATTLYDIYIGNTRAYDKQGNCIQDIDEDAPYKYTIEDVVKFIKDKYDVDLLKREKGSWTLISRSPTPTPHYMLRFISKEGLPVIYSIDGIDGTIIMENINGKRTDIEDYFEKKLKEQKEKK